MSLRNRELLNLVVVGALTALGFASVYIARQSVVSTASLSYAGFFFALYLAAHLVCRLTVPAADPYLRSMPDRSHVVQAPPSLSHTLWREIRVPSVIARERLDLLHSPVAAVSSLAVLEEVERLWFYAQFARLVMGEDSRCVLARQAARAVVPAKAKLRQRALPLCSLAPLEAWGRRAKAGERVPSYSPLERQVKMIVAESVRRTCT